MIGGLARGLPASPYFTVGTESYCAGLYCTVLSSYSWWGAQVQSFVIGGLVADWVGAGIPEADVLVNGKIVTKTDAKVWSLEEQKKKKKKKERGTKYYLQFTRIHQIAPTSTRQKSIPHGQLHTGNDAVFNSTFEP